MQLCMHGRRRAAASGEGGPAHRGTFETQSMPSLDARPHVSPRAAPINKALPSAVPWYPRPSHRVVSWCPQRSRLRELDSTRALGDSQTTAIPIRPHPCVPSKTNERQGTFVLCSPPSATWVGQSVRTFVPAVNRQTWPAECSRSATARSHHHHPPGAPPIHPRLQAARCVRSACSLALGNYVRSAPVARSS